MTEKARTKMYTSGVILLIAGSLAHFFKIPYSEYAFALGAGLVLVQQLIHMSDTVSTDFNVKRRRRLELYASALPAVGAYSMFDGTTLWVPMLLLFAAITLFLSYRK